MSYETKPVAVKAIRAEFYMEIKHINGLHGYLPVNEGQWIVKDEFGEIFVLTDEDFRKRYRPQSPPLTRGTGEPNSIF